MNPQRWSDKHLTPALSPSAALAPTADAERETLLPRLDDVVRWVRLAIAKPFGLKESFMHLTSAATTV